MILAEKIMKLRKQQGWSQEDLAVKLNISRQSVSKWESGASIPDLDKIIKLSDLFGVSTDFLLKDEMEEIPATAIVAQDTDSDTANNNDQTSAGTGANNQNADPGYIAIRKVSLEEANTYMNIVEKYAKKTAIAVAMCILSPVVLILLAAMTEDKPVNGAGKWIADNTAAGLGVIVLLLMVACAVATFVLNGSRIKKYEYLEKDALDLEYGIAGIVERKRENFAPVHRKCVAAGVALCIACAVPLMMAVAFDASDLVTAFCIDMILILVSLGVYMFVWTGCIAESYDKLLEEGDYTRQKKIENKRNENLSKVYWCTVLAIYLGYSFISMNWHISWVIWPCAAVLYAAVCGIAAMIRK